MSDHHGHAHSLGNEKALAIAALLTGGFMLVEVIGGVLAGSLALLADASHMLTDFASLSLAWFAFRLARRPASWRRTYGFDRFSILAAFVNGLTLFLIAIWICSEAYERIQQPIAVDGVSMLWIAFIGLLVNLVAFWILSRGEQDNLNMRAAALHVIGDLLGSVAALTAAVVIIYTGWTLIDPILSVLVALIILKAAWYVVRHSTHILLEGAPQGFDRRAVAEYLTENIEGLVRVHHIHAWSITEKRPMATLQAEVTDDADVSSVKAAIKSDLRQRFAIEHVTVEVERCGQSDVD